METATCVDVIHQTDHIVLNIKLNRVFGRLYLLYGLFFYTKNQIGGI